MPMINTMSGRRLPRRLVQLFLGLALYGLSIAALVLADLGLMPWDVLHQGLARLVGWSLGTVIIVVGVVVLLAWIPLRERPGFGTIANALLVGAFVDLTMLVLPDVDAWSLAVLLLVSGVLLNGLATALYIGSQFGRGPRDGLMTGIARRTGWSLRLVRTGLEVTVVVIGLLLGGALGAGTVLYALAIGPLAQHMLPWCTVDVSAPRGDQG